ncbi:MAG: hypothetical protein PHV43_02765 [Candidatus Colwellbacteria bacterium]|nr:hypothetical protein [Candidatus Colwellbacteria bacterium]
MVLMSTSFGGGGGTDAVSFIGTPSTPDAGENEGGGGDGAENAGLLPIGGLLGVAGGG